MVRKASCIVLVFVILGTALAQEASKPAAIVNGEAISRAELDRVVGFVLKERFKLQPPTPSQKKQAQEDVLTMLIDDLLMKQFLEKNAPKADPAEVAKQFAELVEEQAKAKTKMEDFYKETSQTEAEVKANIATMVQWAAYIKQQVSDAELQRYYQDSKDFFDQVTVRASHILFMLPEKASDGERQLLRRKLLALKDDIAAGKIDFAEAAKQQSQCPATAPNGGDLGFFPRKLVWEDAFSRAAFGLAIGHVSDIIETNYGFHLIKVTERKPGQPSDFEKIKDDVRDLCVEDLRQDLLMAERKKAKIDVKVD